MTDTSRIKEIPENAMSEAQKKVFADLVAGRGKKDQREAALRVVDAPGLYEADLVAVEVE